MSAGARCWRCAALALRGVILAGFAIATVSLVATVEHHQGRVVPSALSAWPGLGG